MSIATEFHDFDELTDYSDNYIYEETINDVWDNCVVLSVFSVIPLITNLVLLNFGFSCLLATGKISKSGSHLITGLIGIYLLSTLDSIHGKIILFTCFISSSLLIYFTFYMKKHRNINNTKFIKIFTILSLILCEYYLVEQDVWLQIRGIIMILVMKLISLADDIEKCDNLPSVIEYFGYALCGANIMFGPWISFNDYLNLYQKPTKKNIWWITSIILIIFRSLFFLTASNCWGNYFIPDDSNRWLVAFKEAFSFRTSHYFICYLAELGMVSSGYTNLPKNWRFLITDPFQIEFPSALVVVVRNWNRPMHNFLKKYVFRSLLNYGKFPAIFATFLISSFLHGFELRVSVVLITIGVFSYLQVVRRNMMAKLFDCCLAVQPCKVCKHKFKRSSLLVKCLLVVYSFLTIVHLTYLGVLMDPSTEEIGIYSKWENLYFISHVIMAFNVCFAVVAT